MSILAVFRIHLNARLWYKPAVSFTISIPDDFADVLRSSHEKREGLALELYREGKIFLRRMARTGWRRKRLLGRGEFPRAAQGAPQLFHRRLEKLIGNPP